MYSQSPSPNIQNPQEMQMHMGMIPMGQNLFEKTLIFQGNAVEIGYKLQGLTFQEMQAYREANINCTGNEIKQYNTCCFACTIIWGILLIFPYFFMCCDWWLRKVMPVFEVPIPTYEALRKLICNTNLQSMSLAVCDNKFDVQKAQILYSILSSAPNLKGFTFINNAGQYNYQTEQFSKFKQNMALLKKLPMMTDIRWGREIVI